MTSWRFRANKVERVAGFLVFYCASFIYFAIGAFNAKGNERLTYIPMLLGLAVGVAMLSQMLQQIGLNRRPQHRRDHHSAANDKPRR